MIDIDFEALGNSIADLLDESIIGNYDIDTILLTAKLVWDNTAIQVTARDFTLIVDGLTYDILDYSGFDA